MLIGPVFIDQVKQTVFQLVHAPGIYGPVRVVLYGAIDLFDPIELVVGNHLHPEFPVFNTGELRECFETEPAVNIAVDEIADAGDLRAVDHWDGRQKLVALGAAYLNEVRLIDNIILN